MSIPPPPVILIGEPGSFPWSVFHRRHPRLIRQVIDALPYGPAERQRLDRLLVESTTGVLRPLHESAHDHEQWQMWGGRDLFGLPWGQAPFLWAESYFYRRLLDATGYFSPGAWRGIDPFAPMKTAELAGPAVDGELDALGHLSALSEEERAQTLLRSALWGNRADLGFKITAVDDDSRPAEVLADDSRLLWAELDAASAPRICFVADNAARELLPDLVLIDHLLVSGRAAEVVLYVKPYPYYVSDATMADVLAVIERLRTASEPVALQIGRRLWQAMRSGTVAVRTHPFFCAPLPFHDMPAELRAEFSEAAMTILKGDLNYRRLVGDRFWPATTPFAEVAAHFPSPVTALRTLKSDVAVGLDAATVAKLDAGGDSWRTSGKHAVIQVHGTRGHVSGG